MDEIIKVERGILKCKSVGGGGTDMIASDSKRHIKIIARKQLKEGNQSREEKRVNIL